MNAVLWILQALLALHTVTGASWKLSSSEATVPSLSGLPHAVWLGLVVLELGAAVALVSPAVPALRQRLAKAPSIGAAIVAGEMLLFTVVALASGRAVMGEVAYWLVVAAIAGGLAVARWRTPVGSVR